MFYNDFILLFIEKYPQKYPLFILLPTKKPSFADNHNKITTRLRQDYTKIANRQNLLFAQTNKFYLLAKPYIFVRIVHFAASRLHQVCPKVTQRFYRNHYGMITVRLPTDRIYYLLRQQSFICWQKWLYISSNTKQALELMAQNVGVYRFYKRITLSMPPIMPPKIKVTH